MNKYKLINNITGWVAFLIAAITYLLTLEPTASFWDCGQFILLANSLQVGHPPGAPFYMLWANIFSQFASDPTRIAIWVNAFSAIVSAFSILFLFWTITHLTRKLIIGNADTATMPLSQLIIIIGSGLVGALAFTWSTSVWFSAVEAEVYAFSIMMTAVVFWLILKWEDNADKPHADKWLVLIAYVIGLSIGVHLLNLLAIPAIVLVYYFKKNENFSWKGTVAALAISFGMVLALNSGFIPGLPKVGGWFELFFVNTLWTPYHTGAFVYLALLVGSMVWAIFETVSKKGSEKRARFAFFIALGLSGILFIGYNPWVWALLLAVGGYFTLKYKKTSTRFINLAMTCLLMIFIGFSSYAMLPIRASANTPVNLNDPQDIFSLGSVLNREQYGTHPLFHGTTFASQPVFDANGEPIVVGERRSWNRIVKTSPDQRDRYVYTTRPEWKFNNNMFFPRMHSHRWGHPGFPAHMQGYERWGGVTDRNRPPTFMQNIRFMLDYQINFMYFRYLMWNFSGRQNDIQADGGMTRGNWITGIPFFDQHILGLGPQRDIAPDIADNRGRTTFFMLPFLLGILGMLFQLQRSNKGTQQFLVVLMLFFMTGVAIVLYLNQTPFEPRERDYSFVGSFYAFAIWIGLGVAAIGMFLNKYIKNATAAAAIATAACLFVPALMVSQNWDSHDRSGRTIARDTAHNFMVGLGENAIIFVNGDNDTFPNWYIQEVEQFRTDVRVANLTFMQIDWYIDQLLKPLRESSPLPIGWTRVEYANNDKASAQVITRNEIMTRLQEGGVPPHEFSRFFDANAFRGDTLSLAQTIEALREGRSHPSQGVFNTRGGQAVPTDKLYLEVNTDAVDWESMHARPTDRMTFSLAGNTHIGLREMMLMEMLNNINNDNWNREIHFATTVGTQLYMNFNNTNNFSLVGMTYMVVPGEPLSGGVNIPRAFDNMVNRFRFGGIEYDPTVYFDEQSRGMVVNFRGKFIELINALMDEGEYAKARIALDRAITAMPGTAVPFTNDGLLFARTYFLLNEPEKANALMWEVIDRVQRNLNWFQRLSARQMHGASNEIQRNIGTMLLATRIFQGSDLAQYQLMVEELVLRAQLFYQAGMPFFGDIILNDLTEEAMMAYLRTRSAAIFEAEARLGIPFDTEDEVMEARMRELIDEIMEESEQARAAALAMDQTLRMMQVFSPRLFERFRGVN